MRDGSKDIEGAEYFKWDHLHGEVEAYDANQNHLGALDPLTEKLYKPAVKGRTLFSKGN